MMNSTIFVISVSNPSIISLLGQVSKKEYCQAKKTTNHLNVPSGTKFYRVHV